MGAPWWAHGGPSQERSTGAEIVYLKRAAGHAALCAPRAARPPLWALQTIQPSLFYLVLTHPTTPPSTPPLRHTPQFKLDEDGGEEGGYLPLEERRVMAVCWGAGPPGDATTFVMLDPGGALVDYLHCPQFRWVSCWWYCCCCTATVLLYC